MEKRVNYYPFNSVRLRGSDIPTRLRPYGRVRQTEPGPVNFGKDLPSSFRPLPFLSRRDYGGVTDGGVGPGAR